MGLFRSSSASDMVNLAEAVGRLGNGLYSCCQDDEMPLDSVAPYLWIAAESSATRIAETEGATEDTQVFVALSDQLRGWLPPQDVPASAGLNTNLTELSNGIQEIIQLSLPSPMNLMLIGGTYSTAMKGYLAGTDMESDDIDMDAIGELPPWAAELCDGLAIGFVDLNNHMWTYAKKNRHRIAYWAATTALVAVCEASQRLSPENR